LQERRKHTKVSVGLHFNCFLKNSTIDWKGEVTPSRNFFCFRGCAPPALLNNITTTIQQKKKDQHCLQNEMKKDGTGKEKMNYELIKLNNLHIPLPSFI
jgi:hypothetical protein